MPTDERQRARRVVVLGASAGGVEAPPTVAPPPQVLVIEDGRARLTHAPKENGARPSVDTLFRSAARTHGANVVAAVLSGTLDDGTAGLLAAKSQGGVTLAQHPTDAASPIMPDSAVSNIKPVQVAPAPERGVLAGGGDGRGGEPAGPHDHVQDHLAPRRS